MLVVLDSSLPFCTSAFSLILCFFLCREILFLFSVRPGTPTATQMENPQFTAIFDGGTKVDLAAKLMTTASYKKDLEFSVNKLVRTYHNI